MIYLDHNATTPLDREVIAAIMGSLGRFGNPSSTHSAGKEAKSLLEAARVSVAGLLECAPREVFFTSGGTEANNLALMGLAAFHGKGHIITSLIEHPSVMNPVRHLEEKGFKVTYIGVDGDCRLRLDELQKAVRKDTFLITVMHSNNETGVLQPIEEIRAIAKEHGITFHTDAAQSAGKIPVHAVMADMITVVPHKFYGPKGTGALYVKTGVALRPILFGAGHEGGLRPGTENIPGIAGMGKACEIAVRDRESRIEHNRRLKNLLFEGLREALGKNIRLNGHGSLCLPNTLNVCVPGGWGGGVDAIGIVGAIGGKLAISTGSACHAGVKKPSPVLKAMGLGDADALSSFRFSVGKDNTEEEIQAAVRIFLNALPPRLRAL